MNPNDFFKEEFNNETEKSLSNARKNLGDHYNWATVKNRAESRRSYWQSIFDQLKPFGATEATAGLLPVDICDLIMNRVPKRSWPVIGEPWGLTDVLVIWTEGEVFAIPWEDINEYRVYDKEIVDAARRSL